MFNLKVKSNCRFLSCVFSKFCPEKENSCKRLSGFTLVELAIVIVIIGFIIAGISAGSSLLQQARLRSVINEIEQIRSGVVSFRTRHRFFPGDIPNAQSYWPTASTLNGNGNRLIETSESSLVEDLYVYHHLFLAGMIKGRFIGGNASPTTVLIGQNIAPSSYGPNAGYHLYGHLYPIYGIPNVNYIGLANPSPPSFRFYGDSAVTPRDARFIDEKIDDGNPATGNTLSISGGGGSCTNVPNNVPSNNGVYLINSTAIQCRMFFGIE